MVSLVQFIIIAAAITTSYGQLLNVTNSTQDYFLVSQRELLHEIELAELRNEAFDARYADRLEVIQYQQDQLLKEIHQVNQTLMPQQALSLIRKHCIQKYNKRFLTHEEAKYRLKICYDRAAVSAPYLISNAKSSVSSARSFVINTLPLNVANCDSYYSQNQTLLEECYIHAVLVGREYTDNYLNNAQEQLVRGSYEADTLTHDAVQCSFLVEKETLETIGVNTKDIDACEVDLNRRNGAVVVQSTPEERSLKSLVMGKAN